MLKKTLAFSLLCLSSLALACDGGTATSMTVPSKVLRPGGVYIAHNSGCDQGCDQIARGDLIQTIDGNEVKTSSDFLAANVTDGQPHKLGVYKQSDGAVKEIEIVATPSDKLSLIHI